MTTEKRNLSNSEVYARLATVNISRGERAKAITALQDGEKIAEVIISVAHVLRMLVAIPALKPNFKQMHQA